jgi:uncharacterized protein YndB with AHSA1/START domain
MNKQTKAEGEFIGREFTFIREFAAPRDLVFKACTDPAHLAQWWGPKGFSAPVCEWDARPGGKVYVVMRSPDGTDYPMGGQFREVIAPERLVVMTGALDEQGSFLFEILHTTTLEERDGKTTLTMHSRVLKVTAKAAKYLAGHELGMTLSLERLADHLAQNTEPFVIERTFEAPLELVWKAITHKEAMRRWYFDVAEFEPEPGCKFEFVVEHQGMKYHHLCKVTEVIPQKRLAYTWRYQGHPGDSLVSFDLIADGSQTRLKLTHVGLETFPPIPKFARSNFARGWTQLVGFELKDFAENAAREIFISREFNAPRELVWEAMTNPRHVVNWWGPRGFSTTIEEMDVQSGGVWKHVMRGPDGARYPNHSVFKEVVKPERIVFANGGKLEGGPSVTFVATWSFDALAADRTRVSIRMVFPSADERDFVAKEFGAVEGAVQTLERMGEHLARALSKPFVISRTFDAPRERVWQAWTEREHLLNWFGPKGFIRSTAKLDFRPGGTFLYSMRTPDGKEMWGKFVYREIEAPERLLWVNSFSDADGGITRHPFSPAWPLAMLSEATFVDQGGKTMVTIKWLPLDATNEERRAFEAARDGMSQGWSGTFEQLAEYLAKL